MIELPLEVMAQYFLQFLSGNLRTVDLMGIRGLACEAPVVFDDVGRQPCVGLFQAMDVRNAYGRLLENLPKRP